MGAQWSTSLLQMVVSGSACANIANAIEARYPGLVVSVGTEVNGHEVDILLKNAFIEVKKTKGGKVAKQIAVRQRDLGLPGIGYAPEHGHWVREVNTGRTHGYPGIATTDINLLLDIIKPWNRKNNVNDSVGI